MIQTNLACGKRRRNSLSVSALYRVPSAASIPVATIRRPSAIDAAEARRSSNGAIPLLGFRTLPGETISQT